MAQRENAGENMFNEMCPIGEKNYKWEAQSDEYIIVLKIKILLHVYLCKPSREDVNVSRASSFKGSVLTS